MFPPAGTYSVPVMKMKRRILILPVLLFALALLRFPQEAAQAVREGLLLCFETVVPSLFPFFVVVSLLIQLGAAGALQRLFTPFMGPLFHLRGLFIILVLTMDGCLGPIGTLILQLLLHA